MSLLTNFQHTWASQRAVMLVLNVGYYWYHALAPHCQPISSPFSEQTHRVSINSCLASNQACREDDAGFFSYLCLALFHRWHVVHPWAVLNTHSAGYLIISSTPLLSSFPGLNNAVWAGFPPYSCQHKKSRDRQKMRVHLDWHEVRILWLAIQMELWKYIQWAP